MRVALAFWGITRSLKYTIDSIKEYIFKPLQMENIEYKIFVHTYRMNEMYTNVRAKEKSIRLDNEEYKLLKPDFFIMDDQMDIQCKLELEKYRTKGDPWRNQYSSLNNFILAMYSKKKVTELISQSSIDFDYVIYLRPDVRYHSYLYSGLITKANEKSICIPNFQLYCNFNDRFAICFWTNYKLLGNIFDVLYEYSLVTQLHSETIHAKKMKRDGIHIENIPFYFKRIRANGMEMNDFAGLDLTKEPSLTELLSTLK